MSSPLFEAERLKRTERAISLIRAGVIAFNSFTYLTYATHGDRHNFALVLIGFSALYALITLVWSPSMDSGTSLVSAITTMVVDNVLIAAWLWATGGFASPYYPLFYAEAAASMGRFGIAWGVASAVFSAALYAGVAATSADVDTFSLVVRIGYIFVIVSFVGHVVAASRRSERLAVEAEAAAAAFLELDRLKSGFVSSVSHELRTPLTAIRGAASTLARNDGRFEPQQRKSLLAMIDRQSGHLGKLVEDMIDVALLDQQKLSAAVREIDIVTLVTTEIERVGAWASQRISLNATRPTLMVECDPNKVGRALRNVLENATKFSPDESIISVDLHHDDGSVYIDIADQGVGIPSDQYDKIFDRFYQVDDSLTRRVYGAGLGLNLAQGLMRLHGGEIRVASTVGKGSRFTIVLPKRATEATSPRVTSLRSA
jgi:signal transduction histidine kinase